LPDVFFLLPEQCTVSKDWEWGDTLLPLPRMYAPDCTSYELLKEESSIETLKNV
jgi:hypothetical protein